MKNNIRRTIVLLGSIIIISVLPFIILFLYAMSRESAYDKSYYAELPVKFDNLKATEGPKIIVIGGSSVAFGIDSKLVEQELNRPCVNFGLYAAFGFKPMLDLSLPYVNEGDIVILAPEISSQMFSSYVGYEYLLEAMEKRPDMAGVLGTSYIKGFLHEFFPYVKKSSQILNNGGLNITGVYQKTSFDEKGDLRFERPRNIMDNYYSKENIPEIYGALLTEDFFDMINDYIKKVSSKKAKVYFSFCPINELSVKDIDQSVQKDFVQQLDSGINCDIIASLEQHIIPCEYFYDSNFHLNDAGEVLNTVFLINDLKNVLGTVTVTNIAVPVVESINIQEEIINIRENDGFLFEITSSGVNIVGLSDDKAEVSELIIPDIIENVRVVKIDTEAFKNSKASVIKLPDSINAFGSAVFSGANNLSEVYINSVNIPAVGMNLLEGASSKIKLMVKDKDYANYTTDYFWGQYSDYIYKQ